jgi:cytochrome c553
LAATRKVAAFLLGVFWRATIVCIALACLAPPGASAAPPSSAAAPPPDTIAERVIACGACHGSEGRATREGYFPRIAGKPADYLYNQLLHFRDGRRRNAAMTYLVAHQRDAYLREIASHFSALDLPHAQPRTTPLAAAEAARGRMLVLEGDAPRRLPACAACHGAALTGVLPAIPGLLGLPRDYLAAQIGAWKGGARRASAPDCMAEVARALDAADIGAVTAWLAAQPVPAKSGAVAANGPLPRECGSHAR